MPRTESNLFADNSQNRKFYYRNGLPGRISFPDRHSARRSPPAGVRSGPQGRHATALKGGSSREPTCLEQIGSAMSKGNLAHHHTCPAFCPRYRGSRPLDRHGLPGLDAVVVKRRYLDQRLKLHHLRAVDAISSQHSLSKQPFTSPTIFASHCYQTLNRFIYCLL